MPDKEPDRRTPQEAAGGRRAAVRSTRTLLYLQERAAWKQGRRYQPQKKNIQAAKFRKEQKAQWKQNRKEEKELKKRRKEFEQEKDSLEKDSGEKNSGEKNSGEMNSPEKDSKEKKSMEPRAGVGKSGEGIAAESRQKQDAKQEAYEEYVRKKKEKQKQEDTSGQKAGAGDSREAEELLRKKKEELEKKEAELKKQEEALKKRKKEEKKDRKQSRKSRRRSRASRTVKGRMKGIWNEDMAVFKSGLKHMPARGTLMLMDDLNAEQMAGRMGAFGIRWVLRLFRQLSVLFFTAAKSVLLLLSPLLLLSVFLVFMLYIIFFSPLSYFFDTGSSGSGSREEMPYRTLWEDVDYTEVESAIKTALLERQQELSKELQAASSNVRLISFAPTAEELADFTAIMKAMMIAGGIYPADIHTWITEKTGEKKCAELAELVCHVLTDEEVEALFPPEEVTEEATEGSNEPAGGEAEPATTGAEPTQPPESGTTQQYVDKYLGFYRLSELKKNGKLKEYELFLDE